MSNQTEIQIRFIEACRIGNLESVQKMYLEYSSINNSGDDTVAPFWAACSKGHLDVCKWLYQVYPNISDYHIINGPFCDACINGHLDVVVWLLNLRPNISTADNYSYAFKSACLRGHLDVAKYLFHVNPNVNFYFYDNHPFCTAVERGHLNVAQWLSQVLSNVTGDIDASFIYMCSRNKLPIVKWLISICPAYHFILEIKKNKIVKYGVRPLSDVKYLERKYLLVSHFKGKQTELLYDLPLDLVRHISSFV